MRFKRYGRRLTIWTPRLWRWAFIIHITAGPNFRWMHLGVGVGKDEDDDPELHVGLFPIGSFTITAYRRRSRRQQRQWEQDMVVAMAERAMRSEP